MFDNIDLTWAPPVLAMFTIVGVLAGMIRWLVKHYFDEIKAEFKPNGGSTLKDQVNRLEQEHQKLFEQFEKAEDQAMKDHKELADKIDKVYKTIIDILKDRK
jgi:predicted glycosyl hydrolase (DUF1957 family)